MANQCNHLHVNTTCFCLTKEWHRMVPDSHIRNSLVKTCQVLYLIENSRSAVFPSCPSQPWSHRSVELLHMETAQSSSVWNNMSGVTPRLHQITNYAPPSTRPSPQCDTLINFLSSSLSLSTIHVKDAEVEHGPGFCPVQLGLWRFLLL